MNSSQTQSLTNTPVDSTLPPGLTPEQRDRILRYRTLRAQGLDEQTAKAAVRQPAGAQSNMFMRVIGKPALQGVGDILGMIPTAAGADPVTAGMQAAIAQSTGQATLAGDIQNLISLMIPNAEPQGTGERFGASGVRGATGGAVMGGLPGAASGVAAGLSGQGAAELGADPVTQMIASLIGGLVPAGGMALAARGRPAAEAGRMVQETMRQQEINPPRKPLSPETLYGPEKASTMRLLEQTPGSTAEQLGPAGQSLSLRVAAEGGKASRTILQHAKQVLEDAPKRFEKLILSSMKRPNGPVVARESVDETYAPLVNALYREARPQPVQVTPEIAQLLQSSPAVRQAYRAAAKRYNVGKTANGPDQPVPPDFLDANGQVMPSLPVAALDEIKRGFDIVAGGKPGSAAKAAADFDAALLPLVDQQVPVYGIARQTAREQINLREATDYVLATPERARGMEADLGKFFQPEELAQLRLIRDQAQQTTKSAQRVMAAGEPRPAGGATKVPIRRLIFEFILGMRRSLGRDVAIAGETSAMSPAARTLLGEALISPELTQADALLTSARRPGQIVKQGLTGLIPAMSSRLSR